MGQMGSIRSIQSVQTKAMVLKQEISGKEWSTSENRISLLVEEVIAGNQTAFEELIKMFQEQIFRLVYYRTGSRMDAEDLTQDIFVKAYQSISDLKKTSRFKSWLFRIAVNRVHDFQRRRRILVFFQKGDKDKEIESLDHEVDETPQPLNHLYRLNFWKQVRRFIKTLGRWEREVFLLRFMEQHSLKDVAGILGKSESTVKTHLYRALHKFKKNQSLIDLLEDEIR